MDPVFIRAWNRIPRQFHYPEARFTVIPLGEKNPVGQAWAEPGGSNYQFGDPRFAAYLASGWNYGIVTGLSRLAVADIDNLAEFRERLSRFKETFTVRTGGQGLHLYYRCRGMRRISVYHEEKLAEDGSPLHIGEIQAEGQQVVGPGSLHKSMRRYEIIRNLPIASVTEDEILSALEGCKTSRARANQPCHPRSEPRVEKSNRPSRLLPGSLIPIDNIAWPRGSATRQGDEIRGGHPLHPSESGDNFAINRASNIWHCWRHETGGGPLEFLAMKMDLLDCDDIRPGCLKGIYGLVVEEARRLGYTIPRGNGY